MQKNGTSGWRRSASGVMVVWVLAVMISVISTHALAQPSTLTSQTHTYAEQSISIPALNASTDVEQSISIPALNASTYAEQSISTPQPEHVGDWRNIRQGWIIPTKTYSDQPYIVQTDNGAWLCVLTTGSGHEGDQGQHIISLRSTDQGKTWGELRELEPPDGPEASYAVTLKAPGGRIFAFYNHNTDNVRQIETVTGQTITRVDSQGYFVFRYSDDHGRSWSEERYTIPVRAFEIDRQNVYGGEIRFFWNTGKAFSHQGAAYVPLIKVGGFGPGFFTSNEGVLLKSDNLFVVDDPANARWETLPEGDIGLRTPPGVGGPIAAEQSYSVMSDGSFFAVYRTIDGHPAYSYSRDKGRTWEEPRYLQYSHGKLVKHPRAANFAWRLESGTYLYWFHNHGGRTYDFRNPAWVMAGREVDGARGLEIEWTQPEILLYDNDPLIRMSYPDLVEEDGALFITQTNKDIARVHEIDREFVHKLMTQFSLEERTTEGLAHHWQGSGQTLPVTLEVVPLPAFYGVDHRTDDFRGRNLHNGFTLELSFTLQQVRPGQILADNLDAEQRGWMLSVADQQRLKLSMNDGQTNSVWMSDPGTLQPGKQHHASVIIDGGPKIMAFVVEGMLHDGAEHRTFGWGRFNPFLRSASTNSEVRLGGEIDGEIASFYIYNRALMVTECIGNYRSARQGR